MGDDSEWLKLPTDDKCVHKVWKARFAGYEEATKIFETASDEKSPEFSKFLGIVKKFVVDNNAIAQEKGLDAVLAFVENAACAGKAVGEVCSGILAKCLNSARTKTKEKGIEILLMYIEIEKQEVVVETLMGGLSNKQPKIVAACIAILQQALSEFGSKVVPIKPMVKQIQRLLEDRDKTVRENGKHLVVEIYRWIGAALKPQLTSLKPLQITELEAEFENIAPGSARQTRFLRSQQDLKAKMEEQAAAGDAPGTSPGDDVGAPEEVDPFDMMDPVEILSKMPKDYYEKIEAKKWQERREALEAVQKLAENPKLESGDYHDLVKSLKKVVAKDTNVMLVTIGVKILTALANGLRKKFTTYATGCIDVILEKFKEKKPAVVAALREAIEAVYQTTTLELIQELCIEALGHKTPMVKAETASFLARCFARCTPSSLPKKILKGFVAALLKTSVDTILDVREASFNALGTAMKVVGEKPMMPFLADIDNLKMAKIKEYYDKAELLTNTGQPRGGGSAPAAAPAAAPPPVVKKPVARPGSKPAAKDDNGGATSTSSSEAPTKSGGARPKTTAAKGAGAGKKGAKGKKTAAADKEEKLESHLSDETVEEKASVFLPSDVVPGLASANWKERLASMEKFFDLLKASSKSEIPAQVCVRVITKKPGLKENNFQVMKLKIELIGYLSKNSVFSKTSASYCITDLVDKVGDVKNGIYVHETLSCIGEATTLEYVSTEIINAAFAQKNPKNQSESLNWLAKAIKEFGFKANVKLLVDTIKKALTMTNPAIRTSAISVMGVMYMYMGAPLRVLFDGEKAALLQQIDAEIEKVKGEKPPQPIRGAALTATPTEEDEDEDEEEAGAAGINVADLVPRNDISDKLTEDLMTEMADKNWKIRKEALEKVIAVLNEAKFITSNIGPLPESLKLRLSDSNKILVGIALSICQTISTAMGPNVKQHIRIVGPGLLGCLGDAKPGIRANALATLNAWMEQTGQAGFVQFVEAEIFSDALKLENPNLRAELLGWLTEKMPLYKKLPTEINMCIPYLYSCLEDRNGEVRKKAQEAVLPFMIRTSYEYMVKQAGKLKPSSKDPVLKILEAARPNLPKKEVKVKPAVVRSASPSQSVSPEPQEDDMSERPSTAPAKAAAPKGKGKGTAASKKVVPAAAPARKKKDQDEDLTPPLKVITKAKEQRFKDERGLKALKWNFGAPRGEHIDQLKGQMEPAFNKTLVDQLFHSDFKNHIKALETLSKVIEECEPTISNLDLLLKWVTLRFFDTNTSVLLKALDYLQHVFNMLSSRDYHLVELEAVCFIPYLINKVGDPKDSVRKSIREILKLVCKIYPASKMFNYIIDGLKSKNSKQRTECLEELGALIEVYGVNVCQPSPAQALKIIAQQISDRDNNVRTAALNTIVSAYCILGDTVYKYIGNLSDKEAGMMEERIKRSSRTRVPSAPAPAAPVAPVQKTPEEKAKNIRAQTPQMRANREDNKNGVRPLSLDKEFDVDLTEITADGDMPSLLEHNLDHLLNEPVRLPERKIRPPSPTVSLLKNSADAKSTLNLVISHVASNDIITSIEALVQIDGVLKDREKCIAMTSHVDQFLIVCSLQLRMTYSKHMSHESVGKDCVIRLYKCLLGSLLALFESKSLAKNASCDVLRDLMHNLITVLLDNRLNDLEDGPQIFRSVNITVVKIVEKSDSTAIMSAFIKLLHETIGNETASSKFVELIMKGLWKIVRMLPEIINDLHVEKIILDLHQFLKAFPSRSWKQRPNDMPLRTTKTILHSLAKLEGAKIMSYLDQIDSENSEVERYLRKVLKNGLDTGKVNKQNELMNGSPEVQLRKDKIEGSKSAKRLSKSTHDMLAEIFKKIGCKENTREGLHDLFEFKQKYPEADLEPFLKKSSQFFQSYIERGLKNIEIEREGKMKTSASAPNVNTGNDQSCVTHAKSATAEDFNPSVYMERLKVLRARCGLDNSGNEVPNQRPANSEQQKSQTTNLERHSSNSSLSSSSSGGGLSFKSSSTVENTTEHNNSIAGGGGQCENSAPANVSDLKKRLQRIKALAGKN